MCADFASVWEVDQYNEYLTTSVLDDAGRAVAILNGEVDAVGEVTLSGYKNDGREYHCSGATALDETDNRQSLRLRCTSDDKVEDDDDDRYDDQGDDDDSGEHDGNDDDADDDADADEEDAADEAVAFFPVTPPAETDASANDAPVAEDDEAAVAPDVPMETVPAAAADDSDADDDDYTPAADEAVRAEDAADSASPDVPVEDAPVAVAAEAYEGVPAVAVDEDDEIAEEEDDDARRKRRAPERKRRVTECSLVASCISGPCLATRPATSSVTPMPVTPAPVTSEASTVTPGTSASSASTPQPHVRSGFNLVGCLGMLNPEIGFIWMLCVVVACCLCCGFCVRECCRRRNCDERATLLTPVTAVGAEYPGVAAATSLIPAQRAIAAGPQGFGTSLPQHLQNSHHGTYFYPAFTYFQQPMQDQFSAVYPNSMAPIPQSVIPVHSATALYPPQPATPSPVLAPQRTVAAPDTRGDERLARALQARYDNEANLV